MVASDGVEPPPPACSGLASEDSSVEHRERHCARRAVVVRGVYTRYPVTLASSQFYFPSVPLALGATNLLRM